MKLSKFGKALCNILAFMMLGWIGYVIYCSIADTGLWKYAVDLLTSDATGRYSPVGAFSLCLIAGILPLMGILFLVIRLSMSKEAK